jgi:hypothetical protein
MALRTRSATIRKIPARSWAGCEGIDAIHIIRFSDELSALDILIRKERKA